MVFSLADCGMSGHRQGITRSIAYCNVRRLQGHIGKSQPRASGASLYARDGEAASPAALHKGKTKHIFFTSSQLG